ncbi:MAG TPA: anti-sigma factor [Candidatus Acidoferrales bacterium]|nr:anti-sigma factor [Candidatus Acidoferrales bacterium]
MTNGHPIRAEEFELFALGVFAGEERAPIQAHIDSCPECARKLAEARGRIALLAIAAPEQSPPSVVKQRLLEKVRAEKSSNAAPVRIRGTRPAIRWWNTIWAPAALALAIATIFLWISDRRLDNQLQHIQQVTQTYQTQTEHAQALVNVLAAQDTVTVKLDATPSMPKAWGYVKYNPRMGMMCYSADLPEPPPNKVYQMWVVPATGNPVSAGVFMPAAAHGGHMPMAKVPPGIDCKWFCVTVEPKGGKPAPTGPKVLVGTLE